MRYDLPVALFNFEAGGQISPGQFSFERLRRAFTGLASQPPAVIVINEAKNWGLFGSDGLLGARSTLARTLRKNYVGLLGFNQRSSAVPAIFYDPGTLALTYWGDCNQTVADDRLNLARFEILNSHIQFELMPEHWSPRSGRARLAEAERIMRYGRQKLPVLVMGDLNGTASGAHLAQRNWSVLAAWDAYQKGRRNQADQWVADTQAVDLLVGKWPVRQPWGSPGVVRTDGCGFHIVAELAASTGTPPDQAFLSTINDNVDAGGGLHIDYLLINDEWRRRGGVVPDTYRIHIPPSQSPEGRPSDHRLVSATLYLNS